MKIKEVNQKNFKQISILQKKYNLKTLNEYGPRLLNNYKSFKKKFPMGWILIDKIKIVGFVGNLIKKFYINKNTLHVAASNSLVVDEKYRQYTLLLLRKFFNQKKIDFYLNTTPNSATSKIWKKLNSHKIPMKNMDKIQLYFIDIKSVINSYFLKKEKIFLIRLNKAVPSVYKNVFYKKINYVEDKNILIKKFNKIEKNFELFFKKYKSNTKKIILNRDKIWFNLHYKDKINKNKAWLFTAIKNKKIIGFIGCIEDNNNSIRLKRVKICDLIVLNDNKKVINSLIHKALCEITKKKYHLVETQGFSNTKFQCIKEIFHKSRSSGPFPYSFICNSKKLMPLLKNRKLWDFSLVDGDNLL